MTMDTSHCYSTEQAMSMDISHRYSTEQAMNMVKDIVPGTARSKQ